MKKPSEAVLLTTALLLLPSCTKSDRPDHFSDTCTRDAIAALLVPHESPQNLPQIENRLLAQRRILAQFFSMDSQGFPLVDDTTAKEIEDRLRQILNLDDTVRIVLNKNREEGALHRRNDYFGEHELVEGKLMICGVSYAFGYDLNTHDIFIAEQQVKRREVPQQLEKIVKALESFPLPHSEVTLEVSELTNLRFSGTVGFGTQGEVDFLQEKTPDTGNIALGKVEMKPEEVRNFLHFIAEKLGSDERRSLSFAGRTITGRTFLLTELQHPYNRNDFLQDPHLWVGDGSDFQDRPEMKITYANRRDTNEGNRCPSCFVRNIIFEGGRMDIPERDDRDAIFEHIVPPGWQQFSLEGINLNRYPAFEKVKIPAGETPFYVAEVGGGSILLITHTTLERVDPKNMHGYLLAHDRVQALNVYSFGGWTTEKRGMLNIYSAEPKTNDNSSDFEADLEIPALTSEDPTFLKVRELMGRIAGPVKLNSTFSTSQ